MVDVVKYIGGAIGHHHHLVNEETKEMYETDSAGATPEQRKKSLSPACQNTSPHNS